MLTSGGPSIRISEIPSYISDRLKPTSPIVSLGVISSVNLGSFGLLARRYAADSGVDLRVVDGTFDNPLEDAERFRTDPVDVALLIPYLDAHAPFLSSSLGDMPHDDREATMNAFISRWASTVDALDPSTRVICCLPHSSWRKDTIGDGSRAEDWLGTLTYRFLSSLRAKRSVAFIDLSALIQRIGESQAIDGRMMFRAKSPYTLELLDELARSLWLHSLEFGTRYPKALVLDCDNTLWGGVIGEDGIQGIDLDPFDYPGNVYWGIQQRLRRLRRQGVLLCLATRNDSSDVFEVLEGHPSMVLRRDDFVATRIGWSSKPEMLMELASELSLGLDSFVFLDDSVFECESVRTRLPQVVVHQVPEQLAHYPEVVRSIEMRFEPVLDPDDGLRRTDRYLEMRRVANHESSFASHEDFLESLDLRIGLVRNELDRVKRLGELFQKTNQFNLTGERLTSDQVAELVRSGLSEVWSCHVTDRFTDHGLTGLVLLNRDGDVATIANLLLSCRVLGRGIEWALIAAIGSRLREEGIRTIRASRVPLPRNDQTSDYLEKSGFSRTGRDGARSTYELSHDGPLVSCPHWISVTFDDR